jgi:hypothetical protein
MPSVTFHILTSSMGMHSLSTVSDLPPLSVRLKSRYNCSTKTINIHQSSLTSSSPWVLPLRYCLATTSWFLSRHLSTLLLSNSLSRISLATSSLLVVGIHLPPHLRHHLFTNPTRTSPLPSPPYDLGLDSSVSCNSSLPRSSLVRLYSYLCFSTKNARFLVTCTSILVYSLHVRAYSLPRCSYMYTRFFVTRIRGCSSRCMQQLSLATAKRLYIAGILPCVIAHLLCFTLYRINFSRHYSIPSRVTSHSKD